MKTELNFQVLKNRQYESHVVLYTLIQVLRNLRQKDSYEFKAK